MNSFSTYLPFSKFEEKEDGTLMVWGRATQEVRDSANEVMDYASSAPLFQRRSQENADRSEGQNLMPLRVMHQNIAAGKVVQFDYADAEKAIDIGALVVDPVEIAKVKNHVYTGFSVGGKYARRWPQDGAVRYTADPREISLVDTPAVPTARLTLFKVDQGDGLDLFREALEKAQAIREERLEKNEQLKIMGERTGISRREGSPLNPPKGYPQELVEYGDPANYDYPLNKVNLGQSVDRFNKHEGSYTTQELHVLGRRISLTSGLTYDPTTQTIKEEQMTTDLSKLDPNAIFSALRGAAAQSAEIGSQDPKAALASLLGIIDSLPQGKPLRGQTVPVQDPSVTLGKAEMLEGETPQAAPKNPFPPKAKPAVAAAPEEESEDESMEAPEEEALEDEPAFKILSHKVDQLTSNLNTLVDALSKRATPVVADSPVGALNSLVGKKVEDPIIKALEDGGPYALLKALNAAGAGDEINGSLAWQNMNNAIRAATYDSLEKGGVITSSRYAGRIYNPQ